MMTDFRISVMHSEINFHLKATLNLIRCAFPDGIDVESYFPLLALLEEEMSDRSLAETIAYCTKKDYSEVLNDIYAVKSTSIPSDEAINIVKSRLLACGYDEWLNED